MKKFVCLFLLICLILQCMVLPIAATEATDATQPTDETQPESSAAFGTTSVVNGCRTINAMSPLGGSEKMLQTAQAAFIYETTTETVIYSYNPDLRLYPGALMKILTAMIAIEQCEMDEELTVSMREIPKLPAGALNAGLKNGEVITMLDALHLLILEAANDAALVIAEHIAGGQAPFVELMNERLAELGCKNTYATTCTGLDDPAQYTTARDMAKIILAASEYEVFQEVFGAKTYTIPPTNKNENERKVVSGNYLVYELVLPQFHDGRATGGMPSYTSDVAGASIAFTAVENPNYDNEENHDYGMNLICVSIGGTRTVADNGWKVQYYGSFEEALDLIEFAFSGFQIKELVYEGQALNQFPVANGDNAVIAQPNESFETVMPVGVNMKHLTFRYHAMGGGMQAPIAAGQHISNVEIWYVNSCITEAKLYAMNPVRASGETGVSIQGSGRDDTNMGGILKFLGIACLIILVPLAVYLVYNNVRRYLAMNKRRRRRASRRRSR